MMAALRRYLVAGLLVWVPLGVTILVLKFFVDWLDQYLLLLPDYLQPEKLIGFRLPGLGLVLVLIVIFITGVITTNLLGQRLLRLGEWLLHRVPLVRSIYSAVKQVMHTVFSDSGKSFRKVVLVEYPRRGAWTMAFLTGEGIPSIEKQIDQQLIHVYVPTTPNPTSGFFLMVPRDEVIELTMSVDDGLKAILSMGVIVPKQVAASPHSAPAGQP